MNVSLVWLRRDLRLHDHVPFSLALALPHPVQPIFVFDTEILARFTNPHDRRIAFIWRTLRHLDEQLSQRGGGLLVLYGKASELVPQLATCIRADAVYSAEDFEPATIARDASVKKALGRIGFVQAVDPDISNPF